MCADWPTWSDKRRKVDFQLAVPTVCTQSHSPSLFLFMPLLLLLVKCLNSVDSRTHHSDEAQQQQRRCYAIWYRKWVSSCRSSIRPFCPSSKDCKWQMENASRSTHHLFKKNERTTTTALLWCIHFHIRNSAEIVFFFWWPYFKVRNTKLLCSFVIFEK
jgi:hypothetical protein